MIKKFSEWNKVNEVSELTDVQLIGKYMNNIISVYQKYPDVRPSRDPKVYANAKKTVGLDQFVKSRYQKNLSDIISDIVKQWYVWPESSKTRQVILNYINNSDDLSNLGVGGYKALAQDPLGILGIKGVVKGGLKTGVKSFSLLKNLFKAHPIIATGAVGAAGAGAYTYSKKHEAVINEVLPAIVAGIEIAGAWLLGTATSYVLYGKEEVYQDPLFFWTAPFLPNIEGLIGDNPVQASYVNIFNVNMSIIYDAWNLIMGNYQGVNNPILSWQKENNYISQYYKEYYEGDDSIKGKFISFMSELKTACESDRKNIEIFKNCPFYHGSSVVKIKFDSGDTKSIDIDEWQSFIRENSEKWIFIPIGEQSFNAKRRENGFKPLASLNSDKTVPGDPLRLITITWSNGKISTASLLQFELWLLNNDASKYTINSETLTDGGSTIKLDWAEEETAPTGGEGILSSPVSPQIESGESLETIIQNIKTKKPFDFVGMGDI